MTSEIAIKKLAELITMIDEGSIHKITRRRGSKRVSIMGDKAGTSPLPTLTGNHVEVPLNLDFTPYPEGGHLLNIEVKATCPFKLVLTFEDVEAKSMKFKTATSFPATEITIDDKKFDDMFFVETLEEEAVKEFLSDGETTEAIYKLGQFDRFVFQYKHLKLIYYIEDLEKLDTDWLFEKIDTLIGIVKKLKVKTTS